MPHTVIRSHGAVETNATETYGSGKVILRISNGGAGATGLLEAIANDYLSTRDTPSAIEWVRNHSRNSQLALLHGHVDVALTYERDQERLSVSEGWAESAGCVFHDHFCLAGPANDPLRLHSCPSLPKALLRIAHSSYPFHTRIDFSATMFKERSIWRAVGLRPWEWETQLWYKPSLLGPAEALVRADCRGAYLLTDRSTILKQTTLGNISNTTVFFEPTSTDHALMNSCYALYSSSTPPKKLDEVRTFLEYLRSSRGQQVIAKYGESQVGLPLFASVEQGYATSAMVGKQPVNRTWGYPAKL